MKTKLLFEHVDLSEGQADPEARVVRNVILIRAGMSKNRRHYSEAVLQKAASLFEGVKAYDGHDLDHKVSDITGWYTNVRYEDKALRGDRHFSRTTAGQNVFAVVEDIMSGRAPAGLAGLSIAAVGNGKVRKFEDGDALEVESISAAHSVDDVTTPAAGGTYLAAGGSDDLTAKLLAALSYEDWLHAQPAHFERLKKDIQTMRESDAVQAAKAEAEHNKTALTEAQKTINDLTAERDAATADAAKARRELAVVEALAKAKLPSSWSDDLRKQLMEADPKAWADIIDREKKKAASAGFKPRVDVQAAGQQVQTLADVQEDFNPLPKENEDAEAWMRRIRQHQQRGN